jgi:putative ATPase
MSGLHPQPFYQSRSRSTIAPRHENRRGAANQKIKLKETEALLRLSGGDGRKLLNIFELVVNASPEGQISITNDRVFELVQQNTVLYDKTGEQHYDIISAFIKSIRGSDPNGAVYWLARMIEGGEDVKFIARRMLILSSEDIGNANPTALVIANNTFQAVTTIVIESRIILSQCAVCLATSQKATRVTRPSAKRSRLSSKPAICRTDLICAMRRQN